MVRPERPAIIALGKASATTCGVPGPKSELIGISIPLGMSEED